VDDPVWVPTVFSKNRDRLLEVRALAVGLAGQPRIRIARRRLSVA
jgi:hypothetical protein